MIGNNSIVFKSGAERPFFFDASESLLLIKILFFFFPSLFPNKTPGLRGPEMAKIYDIFDIQEEVEMFSNSKIIYSEKLNTLFADRLERF